MRQCRHKSPLRLQRSSSKKKKSPHSLPNRLMRDKHWSKRGEFDDGVFSYARQFRDADRIVIAAPFWASSYPASLKTYIEHIDIVGVNYLFTEHGPVGLCKADKLTYVTTRGGALPDEADCGYQNIAVLARLYGIEKTECISAAGLDVIGANVDALLSEALEKASRK